MNIRLFELEGKIVKPTEHCYMISWLNCIIEEYPEDHTKILAYVYYMSYAGPDNPYFNVSETDRETKILRDLQPDFDPEEPMIIRAIEKCSELFMTPTMKSYQAIKTMLENLNTYLTETKISDGREGNVTAMLNIAKNFEAVRKSFKGVYQDVQEENTVRARGGAKIAYDLKRRG
jgi:hypothetical protein